MQRYNVMGRFDLVLLAVLSVLLVNRPAMSEDNAAPANVPLPTEKFPSFARFPPSGEGLRVHLDARRWVELNSLASSGKINGEDLHVFWRGDGTLIDPPKDFDPKVLVPDLVDDEMPEPTREAMLQVVGPEGIHVSMSTSGRSGYGQFSIPVNDEFVQIPLSTVMSGIPYNHAYIEVRVTQEEWETVPLEDPEGIQILISPERQRVYLVTDNAREFAWRLAYQYEGDEVQQATPTTVGGNADRLPEPLQDSLSEELRSGEVVSFSFSKDKPLPEFKRLQRSRYDIVRFDNLSVFPGPKSAVRVSLNGRPVSNDDGPRMKLKPAAEVEPIKPDDEEQPQPGFIRLTGNVVDSNGRPVPKCWIGMFVEPQEFQERKPSGRPFDEGPELSYETLTDSDGTFTILAEKTHFVFEGSFWAVGPDDASGVKPLNATWSYVQNHLTLKIADETGTVRVLDPNGEPVSGARVTLEAVRLPRSATLRLPSRVQRLQTSTTDADGRVTFRGWPSAAIRGVAVKADGYGTQFLNDRRASRWVEGDEPLTLTFQPTGSLSGRVKGYDPDETPDLKLQIRTEGRGNRPPLNGRAIVRVEEDGTFRVETIAAGRVSLESSLSPDSAMKIRIPYVPGVQPGEERMLENNPELVKAVTVRQQVVKSDTGEGIPDMKLRVLWGAALSGSGSWRQSKVTRTDEHGWWSAKVLPGKINIRFASIPDGYAGTAWFDGRNGYLGVEADIPETGQVVILPPEKYVPSKQLSGRLQYADGSAAVGWTIYGHPISWKDTGVGGVRTDREGEFTWTYPTGYRPRFYKARNREWMTEHSFTDRYVIPKLISTEPFVLEIPQSGETRKP